MVDCVLFALVLQVEGIFFSEAGVQVARCPSQVQELICRRQIAKGVWRGKRKQGLECNINSIQKSIAPDALS